MKINRSNGITSGLAVLAVFLLAALAYLPFASQFGYYNDDWYLIYNGVSRGSQVFMDIFEIDRPFRGYFVGWMFDLFGVNTVLYSYAAYFMRCMAALGVLWITRMVWPHEKVAAVIVALLSVTYPGFLDQPNAIDYQSHIWAFTLAIASVAFSLKAITKGSPGGLRAILILLAAVCQAASLLLMEYYIGIEGLRLALMAVMIQHQAGMRIRDRVRLLVLTWLPSLTCAAGFMVWRQFFFQNQRQATDIGGMFERLVGSPILRGIWMGVYMLQDLLNVIFFSWAVPVYNLVFGLRLRDALFGLGLALAAGLAGWAVMVILDRW